MSQTRKRRQKGRYNFLIDESVYSEFSRICDELGLIRSKNIENHMKEFISSGKMPNSRAEKKKKAKKNRYNFLIEESIYQEFSRICDELGLIRSKNIENHMKEFIKSQR